jgi:hypothetical protein
MDQIVQKPLSVPSPLVGDEGVNNQALSGSFSDNSGRQ